MPHTFYSGLTQGRYLSALRALDAALDSRRYARACAAILRSLEVPAEIGGVARRTPAGGLLIEESSHPVPDYVLNGWATATILVHDYAAATGDEQARTIFQDSVRGIVDVLPLYDVAELANSRYRLTGQARIRLLLSHPGVRLVSGSVGIPGAGTYPLGTEGGKWSNRFLSGVGAHGQLSDRKVVAEVLLCRVTWPEPNRLLLDLDTAAEGSLTVQLGHGTYDPLRDTVSVRDYQTVEVLPLLTGRNAVDVPLPWAAAELVAYPTNFRKRIQGRNYNSYHFIHVDALARLGTRTGNPMIGYFHDRWAGYPARWPEMPVYSQADIVLDRYRAAAKGRVSPT